MTRLGIPSLLFSLGLSFGGAAILVGCDDGTKQRPGGDAGADATPDAPGEDASALPPFALLEAGKWYEFEPGGDTRCSGDTPYKFFVYKGTTPNLAINFFGGGGCWNEATCKANSGLYVRDVGEAEATYTAGKNGDDLPGIFDMEDERNPIGGYTQVLVPYCTGDVHWGNELRTYGEGDEAYDLYHYGGVNARAVLDWVFENVTEPETVLTTGCSAGAYGAALWGAHVAHHYDDAHNVMLADSGAGVITPTFFSTWLPNWGVEDSFPDWIANFDLVNVDSITDVYTKIGNDRPETRLAQFNTDEDGTQKLFYAVMGGSGDAWSAMMESQEESIATSLSNFRYYQSTGDQHCAIVFDDFYTRTTDGVVLSEWVGELLTGEELPDNVTCTLCTE
jgi:hypothetical protein